MNKILRHKWIIILIILVLFVAIDGLVNNVSIVDRGIAVGLALDLENDNVVVTAQFILPKNGGVSSGGNNYALYSATGATIQQAINSIGHKLGSLVSLSHTVLLLLNKSIFEQGKANIIEYFLTDDELPDTCLVVATESNAGELLSSEVPFGEVASYQLQRVLRPVRPGINTTPINLKDFFAKYFSKSPGLYLPIVYTEPTPPSTDQVDSGVNEAVVFKSNRTLIFNKDCCISVLTGDAVKGLSLVTQEVSDGSVTISGRDGSPQTIEIVESSSTLDYDPEKRLITVKINTKTIRTSGAHTEEGRLDFLMNDIEVKRYVERITSFVTQTFELSKKENIDLFMAYRGFYRTQGSDWIKTAGKSYLDDVSINVIVSVKQR